jgi:FkbM family methyltransferase
MRCLKTLQIIRGIVRHPLNRHRKLAATMKFVRWQIGIRLIQKRVVHEWISPTKFYVGKGEMGLTANLYNGLEEFEDMAFLLHVLNEEDYFVDVGANAGSYTILAAGVRGSRVCSIEPLPEGYKRLHQNVRLNELETLVDLRNVAVGHEAGTIAFSDDLDTTRNHVLADGEETFDKIEVSVRTLDEILEGSRPTVLKIDVEGFETAVLQGGTSTLADESLHSVIIELNGSGSRYGYDESEIIRLMTEHCFKPYRYAPYTRQLIDLNGKNLLNGNTLFVRDIDHVKKRVADAEYFKVFDRMI